MTNCDCFLDFEFNSSPKLQGNELISIGCVILDKKLNLIGEFYSLIKPKKHIIMDDFIMNLTGISQNEIDLAPSFSEMSLSFKCFINSKYLVDNFYCWGDCDNNEVNSTCIINDCNILKDLFGDGIKNIQREISSSIKKDKNIVCSKWKLSKINEFYNLSKLNFHNSLEDARALSNIFSEYCKRGPFDYEKNSFKNKGSYDEKDLECAIRCTEDMMNIMKERNLQKNTIRCKEQDDCIEKESYLEDYFNGKLFKIPLTISIFDTIKKHFNNLNKKYYNIEIFDIDVFNIDKFFIDGYFSEALLNMTDGTFSLSIYKDTLISKTIIRVCPKKRKQIMRTLKKYEEESNKKR